MGSAGQRYLKDRVIPDDHIAEYVAGTLPPAKHLMITCQREISVRAHEQIEFQESIAAEIMQDGPRIALSGDFMSRVVRALPKQGAKNQGVEQSAEQGANEAQNSGEGALETKSPANDMMPAALRKFIHGQKADMQWKFLAPGMRFVPIWDGDQGERIWMLKVKGGLNMPEHSHAGEEWALILDGSYHVGDQQYARGDLHVEDETCTHIPRIDPGRDCICLVYTEGPLKPTSLIARVLMPFVGV